MDSDVEARLESLETHVALLEGVLHVMQQEIEKGTIDASAAEIRSRSAASVIRRERFTPGALGVCAMKRPRKVSLRLACAAFLPSGQRWILTAMRSPCVRPPASAR